MDACCLYVKIKLYKNYENKFNPFNQVGIVRIACQGLLADELDQSIRTPEDPQLITWIEPWNLKMGGIDPSTLDPMIQDKL